MKATTESSSEEDAEGYKGRRLSSWEANILIRQENEESHYILMKNLQIGTLNPNAKFRGDSLLSLAIKCKNLKAISLLLENGFDPNLKSYEGGRHETPLITATRFKLKPIAQLLIEKGCNLNETNFYGKNALFQAVVENAFDILELILQNMGFCDKEDAHEVTNCPLAKAMSESNLYPLKKKSLRILLKYNFHCECFNTTKWVENNFPIKDAELLNLLYISKGMQLPNVKPDNQINRSNYSLSDLSRITIRHSVLSHVIRNDSNHSTNNFYQAVNKLALPKILVNYLMVS